MHFICHAYADSEIQRPFARAWNMRDVTSENFGLLIAYLLPGFIAAWGASLVVPGMGAWFASAPGTSPSVGGFLYGTLGAIGAGMLLGAVRWTVLDSLHHHTGIPQPRWDFRKLPPNLAAFDSHVRDHFRYYEFYSHTLLALIFTYGCLFASGSRWAGHGWLEVVLLAIIVMLFAAGRDALRKYYARTAALLIQSGKRGNES